MTANELAQLLFKRWNGDDVEIPPNLDDLCSEMLRQQQAEIESLKKQIPDWENINKPNPFIGMSEDLNYKPLPPNSGLGGIALKKVSEK